MNHRLLSAVQDLHNDIRDLSVGNHVPVLSQTPTPMEFLREFVAPNRPCIIANAVSHWPALRLWTNEYLRSKIGSTVVSVDCTPDGRGDAVVDVGPESVNKPHNGLLYRTGSDAFTTAEVLDEPLRRHDHSSLNLSVHIGECSIENTRLASQTKNGTELRSHGNATEGSEHDSFGPSSDSPPAVHEHHSNIDPHESVRVVSSTKWFVTPHTHRMPFHSFLELHSHSRSTESAPRISHSTTSPSRDPPTTNQPAPDKGNRIADKGSCVPYIQHQNGSFTSEYAALAHDAQPHLPWASEALGGMPEAVNMWIGDERSVTSFHKDHYENLYAVVTGEKHFTLLPPTDVARLYMKRYPAAHYHQDSVGFQLYLHVCKLASMQVCKYAFLSRM